MPNVPSIWLLLDERASHHSMVQGVVEKLGWPAETKIIRYNKFARLLNQPFGARLWHVTPESRAGIAAPWPDLVISAGRRCAPVMLAIKKQSPGTKLVHLMWPDVSARTFDLIAVPEHDAPKHSGAAILRTLGSPHMMAPSRITHEAARLHGQVSKLPRPRIALLVGGSAKNAEYEEADFKTLGAYASAEAERLGGSLLITSSPRTGKRGEDLIKSLMTVPHFLHRWQPEGDNPYMAFLGLADAFIVTGDSVSMCSEACTTGKPVYIFTPPHLTGDKQRSFREALFAGGYAKSHTYSIRLDWRPPVLPDAAEEVAHAIKTQLFQNR